MSIRIGIVDDHSIICDGMKNLIEQRSDYKVIFQTCNGRECLELLEKPENLIDVLILDITMPDFDGFQVYEIVKENFYHIKTIFLTAYDDYCFFVRALDMGVDGYLLKNASIEEIIYAIKEVETGNFYIDKHLTNQLSEYIKNRKENKKNLTKREKEIMYHVASGKLNKEIAFDLEIREETVKNHLTRIFKKFNVEDRTQAVVYAMKNNIIDI